MCAKFQIARYVTANIFVIVEETLRPKPRSGQPSVVKYEVMQQMLVNSIRKRQTITSRQSNYAYDGIPHK